MTDRHVPTAYFNGITDGGVRCSCGEDFPIGAHYPDTSKGKPSAKRIKNMRNAWERYREHWQPGEQPPPFAAESDPWEVLAGVTIADLDIGGV